MASSTIIPNTSIRASRTTIFSVTPSNASIENDIKNDRGIGRQYCKYHYEPIQQRLNILGILFINININSNSKTLTTITTPLNQNNLSLSNESIMYLVK